MTDVYARKLFGAAAVFNVLAGLPLLIALRPVAAWMELPLNPTATVFIQLTMALVVIFGGVYWLIGQDPVLYRPYIMLGIVLKLLVVALFFGHWLAGNLGWQLPTLATGDIVFALLFWRYYRQTAR